MRALAFVALITTYNSSGSEHYSPAIGWEYPENLYWGDTHVHTYLSHDAYPTGTRVTPDQAYRFAKGETIHADGHDVRLRRPLDFMMVADHAENMGVFPGLMAGKSGILASDDRERIYQQLSELPSPSDILSAKTAQEFEIASARLSNAKGIKGESFSIDEGYRWHVWHDVIDSAEEHNHPGKFTTFIGYEYSSGMLHRNVVFSGGAENARRVLPFSSLDSNNPEDLWSYLEKYRMDTSDDVISIPHNGNLSRGNMFMGVTFDGAEITSDYAKTRASIEPLIEVTQIKGTSETHPLISPDDEFAGHEQQWWELLADIKPYMKVVGSERSLADQAATSFARGALKEGLSIEAKVGVNPFKFGMIGSTDSHTGFATARESNFWGKMAMDQPSRFRAERSSIYSAAGYAAVWAKENTRQAIFAAMKRREVYATTGPRIRVRFFGGWGYLASDAFQPNLAEVGYRKGVPMGGDLVQQGDNRVPSFLISATREPGGANLDRVQVVKGWRDKKGDLHEKVYDVAWSDNREADIDGRLPPAGSTVNLNDASYLNSIGSPSFSVTWIDTDFERDEAAFYYVRVMQIPTPRWTTYDAVLYGLGELPSPEVIQERAYTSPIWYTP